MRPAPRPPEAPRQKPRTYPPPKPPMKPPPKLPMEPPPKPPPPPCPPPPPPPPPPPRACAPVASRDPASKAVANTIIVLRPVIAFPFNALHPQRFSNPPPWPQHGPPHPT